MRRRKFWGWGYEDAAVPATAQRKMAVTLAERLGVPAPPIMPPPRLDEIELRTPRFSAPLRTGAVWSEDRADRARHSYGASYRDVIRAYRREFPEPPDWVVFAGSEDEIVSVLDWCGSRNVAVIPYGGGSSVVGGVECVVGEGYAGVISLDLSRLDRVLEIDRSSRAARIQAGVFGPALEAQLRSHGLTLRHFPQSFEVSSLGGWIATRSGGHYATLHTHIDDFVEALRVVTPSGIIETRRLPGSGAGPSPDRLFIGSEGTLGIISEAWMRLQDRPTFRASASVAFERFEQGVEAVRRISQSGLGPANCRLLDSGEAAAAGAAAAGESILVLGFESADHSLDAWMARALEIARDSGGAVADGAGLTRTDGGASREGAAGAWRNAFLNAPYARDALAGAGFLVETFETAIPWNRFESFHARVTSAVREALREECGGGQLSCRFTHVYPDGPAPYYSILAPARPGAELEQWDAIKRVASDAVVANGGTITHHHSVGRDHRPGYDRQRPEGFARALVAARAELDPHGILNPGVLFDPPMRSAS